MQGEKNGLIFGIVCASAAQKWWSKVATSEKVERSPAGATNERLGLTASHTE